MYNETPVKTWTWKELKKVVRGGRFAIDECLKTFPDKQKDAAALALCVAHWHRSERGWVWKSGEIFDDYCALCALYKRYFESLCSLDCPLGDNCGRCGTRIKDHPWDKVHAAWTNNRVEDFETAADNLFNVLVEFYQKAWERI